MQNVRQIVGNLSDHFLPDPTSTSKASHAALRGQIDRYTAKLECVPSSLDEHSRAAIEKDLTEFVRAHGNGADAFGAALAMTRAHFAAYDGVLTYLRKLRDYIRKVSAAPDATAASHSVPVSASITRSERTASLATSFTVPEAAALAPGAFDKPQHNGDLLVPFNDAAERSGVAPLQAGQRKVLQSVLYACQGQSGVYVTVSAHEARLMEAGQRDLPRDWQAFLLRFAAVGVKFLRLKALVGAEANLARVGQGVMHQAFAAAVTQHELRDFYRLLAMLQALVLKPVSATEASYLTIDRLGAFLRGADRRVSVLVALAEQCAGRRGGEIGSVLQGHIRRGQALEAGYASRLLRHVCVPLYEMIRAWIYQGELTDSAGDFFVAATTGNGWHGSYELRSELLPSFISPRLAAAIMRAGKSINFLREHCDDGAWVQESAAAAQFAPLAAREAAEPERTLAEMVAAACRLVDARLKGLVLGKCGFMHHADAVTKLLFFGQGDFATSFLRHTDDLLPLRASRVTPFEVAGRLKKAIDASNVRYEPDDVQDRLIVRLGIPAGSTTTVADVLRLQYRLSDTLVALLPAAAAEQTEQISAFIWKTKTMEATLLRAYRTCRRIETLLRCSLRRHIAREHAMWALLVHAGRLHLGMHSFCQALQAYMSFEVLDLGWSGFTAAVARASNVDEVVAAHDAYLSDIHAKALLGPDAEATRETLAKIFALAVQLLHPLLECEAHVAGFVASLQAAEGKLARREEWGSFKATSAEFAAELGSLVATQRCAVTRVDGEFLRLVQSLFLHTDGRAKFHLRFAMARVNFDGFYSKHVPPAAGV